MLIFMSKLRIYDKSSQNDIKANFEVSQHKMLKKYLKNYKNDYVHFKALHFYFKNFLQILI